MIGRLNHIAIAVPDLAQAIATYRDMLGADVGDVQHLTEHGVSVAFVDLPNSRVELMMPLGQPSPIDGFLTRNPNGGLHHICFEVANILAAKDQLMATGAKVLGDIKTGAHGKPVLFLHPKNFNGALIELEQA